MFRLDAVGVSFPLNGLRAFEVVTRHLTLVGAARELHVTPSAVSHQLRNLETYFGTRLLDKSDGKLSLTREGEMLREDLQTAFGLIDRAISNVMSVTKTGSVGVSATPQFASRWLTPRLAKFWRTRPAFVLAFYHSSETPDFAQPDIDVAISLLHANDRQPGDRMLLEADLTPACSPAALAGPAQRVSPVDLIHHSLLHGDGGMQWREWLRNAGVPGLEPRFYEYYQDENVRFEAMLSGEGFVLICPALFRKELETGIAVCPFDASLQTYAFCIRVPDARLANSNVLTFVQWLEDEAARELAGSDS